MKPQIIRGLLAVAVAAMAVATQAQPDAHYVPGIEGIKCATLPPPGFYFRDYNVFYVANDLNNGGGHNIAPPNFQAFVYATVPRAIWISDTKIFGGYLGGDVVLPLVYTSLKAGPVNSSTFGAGDFYGESTLSWHPGQFDIGAAVGFWAPTGDSSGSPTSTRAGAGYWTPEFTLGATWYPDEAKTWSVSALNRYEFNTRDRNTEETPGQAWTLEWGIAKAVLKTLDCGLAGYYQQRTTESTGPDSWEFPYSRVAAVGPEVNLEITSLKTFASLRYNYEFMAENRMQGHTIALTLTKRF